MERGLIARLRRWRSPSTAPDLPVDDAASELVEDEAEAPALEASETHASANGAGREADADEPGPVAEEELPVVAPEPVVEAEPAAIPEPEPPAPPRPLPSFRPVSTPPPAEHEPAPPLSLTLSEAIELVHGSGGDAMELRFLRRELQRRGSEGGEPPDLWPRIEKAAAGRLRRVERLGEGQELVLLRDP